MKLSEKTTKIIIVIFIALFILTLGFLYVFLSNLISDKQTEILTLKRDLAVEKIEEEYTNIGFVLYSVASTIRTSEDESNLEDLLVDIDDNNEIILQMFYGRPDKTYVITTDFTEPPGFDVTTRPWYIKGANSEGLAYTDAYIDLIYESTIMTVVYPVYDNGALLGVIGADIELNTITGFVQDFISEDIGYAFVIDSSANVLAHTNLVSETVLMTCEDYDINHLLFTQNQGVTKMTESGDLTGKIAYGEIENSDFTFGLFMTRAELNQSVGTLTFILTSTFAILLAIGAVIILIYHNFIRRPLNALIKDINQIDIAKNPEFRMEVSNQTQFKDARIALNNLIEVSVSYQKQLEKSMQELSLEVQKFETLLSSSSDIVYVIDKNKRYIGVYGNGLEILGVKEADIIGKTHEEVFGDVYSKEREKQYEKVLNGESMIYSWDIERNNKTYYFENVINPMYNNKNEIIGAVGVARDITEQENRYKELLYISTHDYLTDLYNRKIYDKELENLYNLEEFPFVVINLDLNGLKIINDAYGHEYGDIALKKTAKILNDITRNEDVVCRVSGDEFSVIMPQAEKKAAEEFKNNLLLKCKQTFIKDINLSIAVGYIVQVDNSLTLNEIRKRAENNMYRQKIVERKSVKNKAISAILKTLTDKYELEKKHSKRVTTLSVKLGRALELDTHSLKELSQAAMFHDIGKISLPDNILNKPGKLTEEEYEIVKTHTTIGYDILHTADEYSELAIHASSHHERFDGKGYPNGLKGKNIPFFSRIISIADAYEAMTADRPYRKKMSKAKAVQEIIDNAGTQFDLDLAKIFVEKVLKSEWK
ncbi:MAG: diguanylate cyclase [Candidatus Izemoplasmatales bacterium]